MKPSPPIIPYSSDERMEQKTHTHIDNVLFSASWPFAFLDLRSYCLCVANFAILYEPVKASSIRSNRTTTTTKMPPLARS